MNKSHLTLAIAATMVGSAIVAGCGSKSTWEKYEDWRQANDEFYMQMKMRQDSDGALYYTELKPAWNPSSGVLIHYFNDRTLTAGNLSPMQTSTTSVKYHLRLYNGEAMDSSYTLTDSLYISQVNQQISGWQIALNNMHVGDSAEVIIPYPVGYGTSGSGSILPYSTLIFDIKLVDIPYYEVPQP